MPSNDARTLLHTAVPTAAVGAVAAVVSAVAAAGKGALGAVVGTVVVIVFMGVGLVVLERVAKSMPHMFQSMGLLVYMTQLLVLFVFMAAIKNTTLFNPKAFAFTLVATALVWIAAQARANVTSKTLYVEPDSSAADPAEKTGSAT
ncbi:hypothetical protein [Streptomyces paludis]|uniref:ATP synthase I n=1 Tax=Streptomyces paludis TaxID=2282738 RepID=A0A345HUC3_9ACTN|nr:hypothetical protein [Streptomyces paludis]AXG80297.1 hypothetical protein DVK44_24500 [Streptomyces paludis]